MVGCLSYPVQRIPQNPKGRPMQQIADWLEKLGMSEYAQRFAENDIDFDHSCPI